MEKNILITGRPRTGKSTLISKLIKLLKSHGKKIGGILTPEIREKTRLGFKIIDIGSGQEGILAHINQNGPRISKYRVNMRDLEEIGINAVKYAINDCNYIIIDEIGQMELFSKNFCNIITQALNTKKVLGTIGYRISHPLANQIKNREDVKLITLTFKNRDRILKDLEKEIL